ncbi:hypothetical protein [Halalkalibacter hemicellulosilyticus]|uniref:Uncharacterized protein n=1 Tax=Halalkalibacter hemicellulosilyticusJCM 9152 TaxID=1236971 RepID=W4QLN3_9BACI|nr:hypothetical protein [Halalkalibacter hemicellulosilyticus]GAE32548.1 hypothetical protein JCM9152_4085 [Halalkalibacter hemicellulosilyticusJCM 9152]
MSKEVDVEKKTVEKKNDVSKIGSTLIKYLTYIIIFFGFLWFLVNFVFPLFE